MARIIDARTIEERAGVLARRSIKGEAQRTGLRLALSMVDLTTLEGKDSPEKVRSLCRRAIRPYPAPLDPPLPSVAAVCVYPSMVPVARSALRGSTVLVASVATGFPSGQYPLDVRLADVREAVEAGADEIDMVINRGAFLAGKYDVVAEEIVRVREACGAAHLKIILETGELETYDNVRRASDLAMEASFSVRGAPTEDGAVFIKTSTGKVKPAATMPVTLVMLHAIDDHFRATGVRVGMKPAGGIGEAKTALRYLAMVKETLGAAWLTPRLFRFGASSLVADIVRQILMERTGGYQASYDPMGS
jgi:deoxyribose-phosphate aldolase